MVSATKLEVGQIIRIHNWCGVILTTHYADDGALSILQVQTARNIFRGFGPEYIDIRLNPEAISVATWEDLEQEIERHRQIQQSALHQLRQQATTSAEITPT